MKNKQITLEDMLNQIYAAPDLGKVMFEAINPIIMRSYLLIKQDKENREENGSVFFSNIQDRNAMENIIYKDFPQIVDLYTKLPVEYRNQEKLKTGKTHRQTLLENMEKLMESLVQIEHLQYKDSDLEAVVKTNVIAQKYDQYNVNNQEQLEKETVRLPQHEFDMSSFKKPLLDQHIDLSSSVEQNKKVKIIEGKVEIKVKDKMKAFMAGAYNLYNKFNEYTSDYYFKRKMASLGWTCFYASCVILPTSPFAYIMYDGYVIKSQEAIINNIVEAEKYIKEEDNIPLKEINIKMLEAYAKKNPKLNITVNKNTDMAYIDLITDKEECVNVVYRAYKPQGVFTMNGGDIPDVSFNREAAQLYCDIPLKEGEKYHFHASYRLSNSAKPKLK